MEAETRTCPSKAAVAAGPGRQQQSRWDKLAYDSVISYDIIK